MKKVLLSLTVFGLSASAFAAPTSLEYLAVVVSSEVVKSLAEEAAEDGFTQLNNVEKTAAFRCPGCYEYTLTFVMSADQEQLQRKVRTRLKDFQSSEVEVTEVKER